MHIALLGATGAVGRTMLQVLRERDLPVDKLTLLASERSAGREIEWNGKSYTVQAPARGCFRGVDYALFSAGADRSLEWGPRAADEGAVVVDNSSAFRTEADVPLVVPEVNLDAARNRPRGIIANPNCSTIQMVVALEAIRRAAGLTRVVASTYQSVSGAGETGRDALRHELAGQADSHSPFARPIAGNVLPQIGSIDGEGWTGEERKIMQETRKILSLPDLAVTATCVRVPVDVGHSVSVMAETEREISAEEALRVLAAFPGVVASSSADAYPTAREIAGRDEVFVGRVRRDPFLARTLHLWVVADNLRKGAATNAVQIVEELSGA
ncbi:aspartate-semialdehyde dehydrogenase [Longimicrobium terrae]|uniref:Aspartate-semialdehyde dehydrogenase n=1 Tax=Longimicrobium terrae TaxID=1639882 RepID=A0A841H1M5_9BACT|nr:aspartate-semialdehyde dehydrogenase [Longimicrobium terrae]MBB4637448.1 aspartate-semialdehyde dehydrogenase [Longimicrobium terrae]MBB6071846.1 aspartate-semialdehyde dehydrogenase [Longimicrobium terrae]NNC30395.1 aspartate-semialdehyde dehydrogenase [Longimicrobium terrae]